MAKIFRYVLGIAAVAYVTIRRDRGGLSRLCTKGTCCAACKTGAAYEPEHEDLCVLLTLLLSQVQERRCAASVRRPSTARRTANLWLALECMID